MKKLFSFLGIFLIFSSIAFSQVDKNLGSFPKSAVEGYIKPLVDVMGANLNSGLYHTASMSKLFGFYIGVKGMAVFVPSSMKNFTAELGSDYNPSSVNTATVFGDKDGGAKTRYQNVVDVNLPGGTGLKIVPLAVPQVSFSTMNSELLVRFVPSIKINDDVGSVNLFGVGLGHSISQYIPMFPINVAVQGVYQQLKVGSYLKATALNVNVHASKSFIFFTIYGGVGYESFSADINYTYKPPVGAQQDISLSLKGKNNFRATAGFKLGLAIFDLNVDYSVGNVNVLSAGFGFSF
ncbi:DUF6588 family protein [Candidatus Chrysopegis kryptomonas]|jgi:hypothetical protein|uniref:Outer membrane protein beta-barrel domain-containing protein n=1 Tax=Candidatus Chryseopegocella kryptomonas TaxID=1633643 RepID=A0A0N7MYQ1_9BACT|nr:DUF6588 family protein [Candidatus Chrysopegis kryptomonas]CUT04867.1 hypothetical protein JGI23_01824 [Candidatus Chrysopegis kryptomonas]